MNLNLQQAYGHYIEGEWVKSTSGETFETINPASGEILSMLQLGNAQDVDKAVKAAWKAYEAWGKMTPAERAAKLLALADRLEKETNRIAMIETLDNGKPIKESMFVDLPLAVDHFRYFASIIRAEEGSIAETGHDTLSFNIKEPLGVIAQIIPWNFPLLMAAWKLAPALAAGNCVVIKPASVTALSLLEFMKLAEDVLPPGVVNVVTGPGSLVGVALAKHPGIRKVSFTGETVTGRLIIGYSSENIIPTTLELGGKSPQIVFEDAFMEKAIEAVTMGICFNQGQVCTAGSRALIQASIYKEFVNGVIGKMDHIKIGDPTKEETMMGPLVSMNQLKKVLNYIEIGKREGARLRTGGKRIEIGNFAKGFFVEPTLFDKVDNKMRIAQEEIFGPVLSAIPFRDEDEAIEIANDVIYGLGAAVHTKDINKAFKVCRAIKAGRVWVNYYHDYPAHAPFGGYKKSGFGRENHKIALEHYQQNKNILINLTDKPLGVYEKK
jgi:acyl-CoA reductase-like NAD-dependent aldehyde dehydrogenase